MPYSLLLPSAVEQVEADTAFVVPAINGNVAKLDAQLPATALMKCVERLRAGTPVRLNLQDYSVGTTGAGGVFGVTTGPQRADNTVRVQFAGEALVRAAGGVQPDAVGAVAFALPGDRTARAAGIDSGVATMDAGLGVITGAVGTAFYKVMLGARGSGAERPFLGARLPAPYLFAGDNASVLVGNYATAGRFVGEWVGDDDNFQNVTVNDFLTPASVAGPSLSGNALTLVMTRVFEGAQVRVTTPWNTEIVGACSSAALSLTNIASDWLHYGDGNSVPMEIRIIGIAR